ncbi:MAG: dTDP-4-dehydrorhamnose reductase [Nitrospinae bacterium]|nr:dTDP-4-dehydrorhamnose reductase [Nitrospinota bacterium]MBL7021333.1 dTDP-4-dehydrorhamnose reductase [Nitrospinaceae bacterium]
MKILLTGKNGQVGWELNRSLAKLGTVFAMGRDQMDLSRPETLGSIIQEIRPDIIINAAAYTAVDKAESEPELAMTVNGIAPGVIAEEAKKIGAGMIHYSTDYVFDGKATSPYKEEDSTVPLNIYGKSKLAGEKAVGQAGIDHIILRTGWVYSLRGSNFLLTVQKLAQNRKQIKIVDDQRGGPTWARTIAEGTAHILEQSLKGTTTSKVFTDSGVFHMTCDGETSWFGFANKIFELSGLSKSVELIPIPTIEYPTPAVRPGYSLLSNSKLKQAFGYEMPQWQEALQECMDSTKAT